MSTKSLVMIGMVVGSTVGGFVPTLWGADVFSYWSMLFTLLGGIAGIWLGSRLGGD